MKILLISPLKASGKRTHKTIRIPQLTLHLIKALTPSLHNVHVVEEEYEEVDVNEECDLVGFTCMTTNAIRAYEFADEFRKKGKTVVMGGIHPTVMPDEALLHADAVVIGEAENVWQELLEDHGRNNLKRKYYGTPADLSKLPVINLDNSFRNALGIVPLITTRGCQYNCDFCSATKVFGKKIRHVPVPNVVRYLQLNKVKRVIFLDDNIVSNKAYAIELFTALKGLGIEWVGNASISIADDDQLLQLAAKSGCYAFFIGLETVMPETARRYRKAKTFDETKHAIKKIMKSGIKIHASMIFGFDSDDISIFSKTVDFLTEVKIHSISFNMLTPFPGTALFDKYDREGRITSKDWSKYEFDHVIFTPKNLTSRELKEGVLRARNNFNSLMGIVKRLPANFTKPFVYLSMNYTFHRNSKRDLRAFTRIN